MSAVSPESNRPATPYRIVLAVADATALEHWVELAIRLTPAGGEVLLRGLVCVPEGQSLSEGTNQASLLRDALDKTARDQDIINDETKVHVDYRPMMRLIAELETVGADLLLAQWAGPEAHTGGMTTEDILLHTPADVALIGGEAWHDAGPVLLSLRGGPNISLGVRVAKALARESAITLFHTADSPGTMPALGSLMRADPRITRTVTAVGGFIDGIVRESAGHKAMVIGAASAPSGRTSGSSQPVVRAIQERVGLPLALVRARTPEEIVFHLPRPLPSQEESLSTRVDRWFAENTFHCHEFEDLKALLALKEKQGLTISLGLPALNEEKTVGRVISTVKRTLMDEVPLLDEIVLIDSNSTDNTVAIAESLGVRAYRHPDILPEIGTVRGKGEALWKSLHVLTGDLIAWIDTDITNIHPRFVYGLIGPLLKRPSVQYVKGFYRRPIRVGEQLQASGGGRVTELVARPLLNLFYPELSGIIQPLSGEYAGRRVALEAVPFFSGYGVETGLILDLHEQFGLNAIAQVDLEERIHHNQPLVGLSKMSFAIHQVFAARLEKRYGVHLLDKANRSMKLIIQEPERFALEIAEIGDLERPPMITVPAYIARRMALADPVEGNPE